MTAEKDRIRVLEAEVEAVRARLRSVVYVFDEEGVPIFNDGNDEGFTPMELHEPVTAEYVRKLYQKIKDDPELDATDFAHPAWWRGEEAGVRGVVRLLRKALKGEPGGVTSVETGLEPLRADIHRLVESVRDDIADAKSICGGDGIGCEAFRGYYGENVTRRHRKCGHCPMAALASTIEAIEKMKGAGDG